ncbi:MAG: CinA family nicotinamide mononucleotide deamidase-related protein [Alphaproteobacteria bacterium]|nr:CinA family nicotinamide mononucleotide deamidase-related protein [Alphaproteobacteria bacterium]MCB9795964.1 CinA family nicotinamide mononucleotide deamidase-related protein [Alphaproteobacteria bacterium]
MPRETEAGALRPTVVILSQGDEVITGQTVDTNAAWLAERLTDLGFLVILKLTVGDDLDDLIDAIDQGMGFGDLLICTGGLGPTVDDLTAEAAAAVMQVSLVEDAPSVQWLTQLMARYGRELSAANRKQCSFPRGAVVLPNLWGTAPGFSIEDRGCIGFFVPGVPREMKGFWDRTIEPALRARFQLTPGRLVTLRCMGVAESRLEELLQPFAEAPGVTIGFRTKLPENQVKLRIDPDVPQAQVDALTAEVRAAIGKPVFGVNCGPIEQVIGELLAERGETLASAESCTGGLISASITSVSGASRYFMEGACVYANEAKMRTCGVLAETLDEHGAVSEPTARQMAEGIRERAGTTYGLATTGIAGPGGGTPDKPVGTVFVALATPEGTHVRRLLLAGDRERITRLTVGSALDMLRRQLQGLLRPPT